MGKDAHLSSGEIRKLGLRIGLTAEDVDLPAIGYSSCAVARRPSQQ